MIVQQITQELDAHFMNRLATARGDLDTRSDVVMVLPRPGRTVLVLTKSFYPSDTYNLPSGGIHPGETPEEAFLREVAEETGLPVSVQSRIGRIKRHCFFGDTALDFTSHFILGTESTEVPHPSDDTECISGYLDANADSLRQFARNMRHMTGHWLGFGRFRATPLDFVADYLVRIIHEESE